VTRRSGQGRRTAVCELDRVWGSLGQGRGSHAGRLKMSCPKGRHLGVLTKCGVDTTCLGQSGSRHSQAGHSLTMLCGACCAVHAVLCCAVLGVLSCQGKAWQAQQTSGGCLAEHGTERGMLTWQARRGRPGRHGQNGKPGGQAMDLGQEAKVAGQEGRPSGTVPRWQVRRASHVVQF
jgi:hypothetical protein